jgi:hypothetical protein
MRLSNLKIAIAATSMGLLMVAGAFAQPPQGESGTKSTNAPNKRDNVTGAFEGWFKNPDGTFSLLLGYFNRTEKQEFDVPIGPENKIEPSGPDRGQPTHFLPGRQWGMFAVKVPANFGTNKITWTITSNGKTAVIPASLLPDYEISPFKEAAVGNTPPILSFEETGPSVQGPLGLSITRTTTVAIPLSLTIFGSDDGKWTTLSGARPGNIAVPVRVRWVKYRGPGQVTFDPERPSIEKIESPRGAHSGQLFTGKATTSAKFSAPGDYVLHVIVNDLSGDGGGGEQCCWTFGDVKVSVKP